MKEIKFMLATVWDYTPHDFCIEVEDDATEQEIEETVQSEIMYFIKYWKAEE